MQGEEDRGEERGREGGEGVEKDENGEKVMEKNVDPSPQFP